MAFLNRGSYMNYDKYRCDIVEEDHTLLGKLGIEESTVASMKKGLKTAAGLATSAVAAIVNTGKVVAPGVAHATSLVAGAGLAARDTAAATSTAHHIDGLKTIQSDLTNDRVSCSCGHCLEVVGYAISQKTKKLARKTAAVASTALDTLSPIPIHTGLAMRGGSVAHTVDKQLSGTRGVERGRQAELLYDGARGVRWHAEDGSITFQNYCVAARALVDELTSGHWKRWVSAKGGQEEVFRRLSSKNM
jgi:hypothetical protein